MATIEKRGDKYRIKEMRDGITYRVTVDFKPTKREAEDLIRERIGEGSVSGKASDTFSDAAQKYMEMKSNILSPWTINGYNTILRALSDHFKRTRLTNMDGIIVQKEINDYSATHSPKSTRNAHGFISAVLSVYKPSLKLSTTLPQKAKYEAVTPSQDDIKKILDEVSGTLYDIPYRLGCYGMRRGEICAISAADLDGNYLTINKAKVLSSDGSGYIIRDMPKTTESNRTIYIDDTLAEMIRNTEGEIFPYNPPALRDHLSDLQKDLGIPHFRFHDFRAFYASMAHAMGIPDKYIMANGGWSSTHIMDRVYKRAFADKQAEANQRFSGIFGA